MLQSRYLPGNSGIVYSVTFSNDVIQMLVFKNNIYNTLTPSKLIASPCPDPDYDFYFDPKHIIEVALTQEEEVLSFIERQPQMFWREDFNHFYPHAGKINSLHALKEILRILKWGLNETSCWHHMNSYHFCFLYDVMVRFSFDYNQDSLQEKKSCLPELDGKPVYLRSFINNYFHDQSFLVDPEHYNSLQGDDKIQLGYVCPCLFGVLNGLSPTKEEMALKESTDYPYTVLV